MTTFNRLQERYVTAFEAMTKEELTDFLSLLESDHDAPYRERRIKRINDKLSQINNREQAKQRETAEWIALAKEDKEMKERWLKLGATFRNVESMTIWEYQGKRFYIWFSGVNVTEEIIKAREANNRLLALVEEKRSGVIM
ncbi:hypothetical protein [Oceanobacillus caeni]|uniref:hypothetical protein n=1 Tax=Oceanobacillus caeni TaxID=405946 RepID=UPI003644DA44